MGGINNPWSDLYKDWPARDDREARALELLSQGKIEKIMEETGMNNREFGDFIKKFHDYETKHLCVTRPREET